MKITYINEAVRLPSGASKKVSLTDIQRTNETYIKQQICDIINEEFNNVTGYDSIQPNTLRRYFFGNCDNDDYTTPIDFSSAIDITRSNDYKYIVHLCTHVLDAQHHWMILDVIEINHLLNYIRDRHSDLISDIQLTDATNVNANNSQREVTPGIKNIEQLPYPTSKFKYYDDDVLKTVSRNLLVFMASPYITDEQYQGLTEYMLRFDNVTSDGVECMLKSLADSEHKYRPYGVFTVLQKILNNILPKFKFKFSKIIICDDLGIDIDNARVKALNMQQRIFDPQKLAKIAYDFDKFYVEYNFDCISRYIWSRSKTETEFYTQDYSSNRRSIACDMFTHISKYYVRAMTRNNISIGYYPKLDKLCFIHTDNAGLSPEDMFVPIDKVIDVIIENAINPNDVSLYDIDSGLIQLFSIK